MHDLFWIPIQVVLANPFINSIVQERFGRLLTEDVDIFYFQLSVSDHFKLFVGLLNPLFLPANRLSDSGSRLFTSPFSFCCFHIDLVLNGDYSIAKI